MKIQNEHELTVSFEWLAKMAEQREVALVEPSWDEESRQSIADDIEAQRLSIERDVWKYLKEKYEPVSLADPSPVPKM
ncbi:MAG: hypothetical protein H8F28_09305 [Fibrella sp.]|nr:hypothetical protein [Armatimonadota bacterium]